MFHIKTRITIFLHFDSYILGQLCCGRGKRSSKDLWKYVNTCCRTLVYSWEQYNRLEERPPSMLHFQPNPRTSLYVVPDRLGTYPIGRERRLHDEKPLRMLHLEPNPLFHHITLRNVECVRINITYQRVYCCILGRGIVLVKHVLHWCIGTTDNCKTGIDIWCAAFVWTTFPAWWKAFKHVTFSAKPKTICLVLSYYPQECDVSHPGH